MPTQFGLAYGGSYEQTELKSHFSVRIWEIGGTLTGQITTAAFYVNLERPLVFVKALVKNCVVPKTHADSLSPGLASVSLYRRHLRPIYLIDRRCYHRPDAYSS